MGYVVRGMERCNVGKDCGCQQSFFTRVGGLSQGWGQAGLCLSGMWAVPQQVWHAGSVPAAEAGKFCSVVPFGGVPRVGSGGHGDLVLRCAGATLCWGLDLSLAVHGRQLSWWWCW